MLSILNTLLAFATKRILLLIVSVYNVFKTPVTPITNFDINKYLGEWQELYSKPQWFQTNSQATAKYTVDTQNPTKIVVTNIQDTSDIITGEAIIGTEFNKPGSGQTGTLWVTFNKIIKFYAPYWIVYAIKDQATGKYVISVVSDPLRFTFWTLVRKGYTPTLQDHINLGVFIAKFYSYKAFDVTKSMKL